MESQGVELRLLPSGQDRNNHIIRNSYPTAGQSPKLESVVPVFDVKETASDRPTIRLHSDEESDWEKNSASSMKWCRKSGAFHLLSSYYAKFLVAIASVLMFTELLHDPVPLLFFHGYLFTYLVGGGIVCFIGLYVSILADKCSRYPNDSEKSVTTKKFDESHFSLLEVSFYLRVGTAVLGVVVLIGNAFEIASIFTMPHNCMDELNLAQPVLQGLFSLLQLHFLFMDVRSVSHYLGIFRHAALMHLLATNIIIALRLVLWKSTEDWLDAVHVKHNSSQVWPSKEFSLSMHTLESDSESPDISKHGPIHKVYFTTNCWWRRPQDEKTEDLLQLQLCLQNSTVGSLWKQATPYFYPFVVQYCIAAAAIISAMWSTLNYSHLKTNRNPAILSEDMKDSFYKGSSCCNRSIKGLSLGFIVFFSSIIIVILSLISPEKYSTVFNISTLHCIILGTSVLSPIIGLLQIKNVKCKILHLSKLTEALQNIGMCAIYLYGSFTIVVGAMGVDTSEHLLLFLDGSLMVLQACLQSLFIHQVAKKCLKLSSQDENPGRNVVVFLACSCLSLWLLESMTVQQGSYSNLQRRFYGNIVWPIISRIFVPLIAFYRFHSAISLMEIWNRSYRIRKN